jgi:hypothetical protein
MDITLYKMQICGNMHHSGWATGLGGGGTLELQKRIWAAEGG